MDGKTLRFNNFLLDTAIFVAFMMAFFMVFRNIVARENVKWISMLCYFLYYFLFEFVMGQTPGKIITHSKVISFTKNNNYHFSQIFIRTLIRFIPIDIISYLFSARGLHDWISNTAISKL